MKHLFNDIPQEEKDRILEMHGVKKIISEQEDGLPEGAIKNGKKVEIEIPGPIGDILVNRGFDYLIENLPDTIDQLLINNKSEHELNFVIPPTISKFQEMNVLFLRNCVSSLPEEIGDLENLTFLALPDNPNLETIPQSIVNLPKLLFISLGGSNPALPDGFEEKFDNNRGFWVPRKEGSNWPEE